MSSADSPSCIDTASAEVARFISFESDISPGNRVAHCWQRINAPFFTENGVLYSADRHEILLDLVDQQVSLETCKTTYTIQQSTLHLPLSQTAQAIDIACCIPSIQWAHISESFSLTASEMRVMYWTALGCKAAEIANKTSFTTSTVHTYQKNIYAKLDISRQNQLTACLWLHS